MPKTIDSEKTGGAARPQCTDPVGKFTDVVPIAMLLFTPFSMYVFVMLFYD